MGHRRAGPKHHDRDDEHVVAGNRSTTATLDQPRAGNVRDHLLSLQRDYGNAAVTTLVVQRRDRPQSTDAPGAKKKKTPPKKKEAPPEDYAPKEKNPKLASWSDSDLVTRAAQELDSNVKNSWYFAAELYEEYWFRNKSRGAALGPHRAYKKLGDDKRAAFWHAVMQGKIDPGKKKDAEEDQTGKEF